MRSRTPSPGTRWHLAVALLTVPMRIRARLASKRPSGFQDRYVNSADLRRHWCQRGFGHVFDMSVSLVPYRFWSGRRVSHASGAVGL